MNLSTLPSLQRQQTEQLVKSIDFYVYLWGLNDKGQLLNGTYGTTKMKEDSLSPHPSEKIQEKEEEVPLTSGPCRVKKLQHKAIAGMNCSSVNSFIWDVHDVLWAGGSTELGLNLLGMDLEDFEDQATSSSNKKGGCMVIPRPTLCETLGEVTMVHASNTHALAILET
ncbi:ubiquitin-transferase domain containing, partial [Cystoisospora suis]